MNKKRALTICPVCGGRLEVVEYRCPKCGTVIRGVFSQCEFCQLNDEQFEFLQVFLRARGNLSEVAKHLGISHPTARARLSSLLDALGYKPLQTEQKKIEVMEVLEKLERGEITAEEAEELLKGEKI